MRAPAPTEAPRIDALALSALAEGDPADLVRDADLDSVLFHDLSLADLTLPGALVGSTRFTDVAAGETDLRGARLHEVELDRVNLPVVRAARSQWRDVRVTGRLGSLEAYEVQWRAVHFVGCKLSFVNLRGAELVDVAFTDCTIEELDLGSAVARRVALPGTRVVSLGVRDAELRDVDLRGATIDDLDGLASLRGATISSDQLMLLAPLMAVGLGLRVE